jgi:hypothetical protein
LFAPAWATRHIKKRRPRGIEAAAQKIRWAPGEARPIFYERFSTSGFLRAVVCEAPVSTRPRRPPHPHCRPPPRSARSR